MRWFVGWFNNERCAIQQFTQIGGKLGFRQGRRGEKTFPLNSLPLPRLPTSPKVFRANDICIIEIRIFLQKQNKKHKKVARSNRVRSSQRAAKQ